MVGWLKRLFGTTDAMEDAIARGRSDLSAPRGSPHAKAEPPLFSETESELVFTSELPGLDPETVKVEPEGSSLRVKASGHKALHQLVLDERIQLPEGSHPDGATASYEGTQLIIRIPKSALPGKTHADSVDDDETVDS